MFRPAPVGVVDRAAEERDSADLFDRTKADPRTRVLLVHRDAAPRSGNGLGWLASADLPDAAPDLLTWAFLGRDDDGAPVLAAVWHGETPPIDAAEGWAPLREVGADLPEAEAELLVVAVSLGRFLGERFCAACGAEAELTTGGWARRCTGCRREIFPRTDPAVIVAIESEDGERLLLGANVAWRGRMYSCFAGFVEAGESLETAIGREIAEEAGVRLTDVRYVSSQGWPYPRSLMLGFRARTVADDEARADGSEIVDVRWFTRDQIRVGLDGRGGVGLPGPVSIAHRLIRDWAYGGGEE